MAAPPRSRGGSSAWLRCRPRAFPPLQRESIFVESEGRSCRHPVFWRGCWACSAPAQPCPCSAPEDSGDEVVLCSGRGTGRLWHPGDSRGRLCGVTAQPVPCLQGSPRFLQTRHRGWRLTSKTWGSSPQRGPASGSARARAVLQEVSQDPETAEGVP